MAQKDKIKIIVNDGKSISWPAMANLIAKAILKETQEIKEQEELRLLRVGQKRVAEYRKREKERIEAFNRLPWWKRLSKKRPSQIAIPRWLS